MSRNNTGNPLGSKEFLDFEDNVRNLDEAVNSDAEAWTDRFGVERLSLAGFEGRAQEVLAAAGYVIVGDYAPGIVLDSYNKVVRDGGEFWRVSAQVSLPYTTTGAGIPEGDALVSVGDAVLRGELADPDTGSERVGHGGETVSDWLGPYSGVRLSGDGVSDDHLLIRNVSANSPTRAHQEPNGYVDQGTIVKYDWMFDPFDDDQTNYRIVNIYTKQGKGSGYNGQNGIAVVGAKGVGNHFGVFPTMNFGFSDDNQNGVPMKLVYFDTADTEWRTPMVGAWRAARQDIAVGDHILSDFNIYVAATAGTTGATQPTHTSGTVSDGGVEWTFIRRYFGLTSFKPCVMIGDRDDMPKFGFPDARMQISKNVVVWNGQKLKFLDNSGAAVWEIGVDLNTDDFHIRSLTGGGSLRFDAAGSFVQNNGLSYLMNVKAAPVGATTVDVKGSELIGFGNTSATSVTAFTGQPYQRFFVQSSNGQTTLVHGANIKLAGAVDRVLGQDDVLQFVMNSSGSVAKQVL
jgi:hypothetical protein